MCKDHALSLPRILASAILVGAFVQIGSAAPKTTPRMINLDVAKATLKSRAKATETTAAFEKRIRADIKSLLSTDLKKLGSGDTTRWRLLDYLRELPWASVSPSWREWYFENQPNPRMTDEQREAFLKTIRPKPIYKMKPKEIDVYLGDVHTSITDLRARVMHFARKNLGQPYQIYLLGEFPYELYDTDPLYCFDKGDCVVFSEHTYAMALSRNWDEFFRNLVRLRYKNGEIGMTTRNHYTEADWDKNNSWLIHDVTDEIGATSISKYRERIDRAAFFRKFGIGQEFEVQEFSDTYIPAEAIESVLGQVRDGDFVNIVRGNGASAYVGHTGLVGHKPDGTVTFIHSTPPKSTEQPMLQYVQDNVKKNPERSKKGQAQFLGIKFLRLRAEDLQAATKTPAR